MPQSFGRELLRGFERGLEERQLATVASASYDRKDMKLDAAVARIVAASPQAILMACAPSSDGRGVAISQVVPHPGNVGAPVVKEFHLVCKVMEPPLNHAALEGFIGAKLLVEGPKRRATTHHRRNWPRHSTASRNWIWVA